MKKKILLFAAIIALTVAGVVTTTSVKADINPDCPNGCLANGDGCYCNGWYPCYLEATHAEDQLATN